ncbi:4-hydroxy-tetrahydrodipicolinate reductase [Rariglobus hedericola]|uniref:4-hydroxy-tetrahydrodipicolinate reductase n=1 Tax=Rariglobus hedericola TaxID=2597822 RepID=A0A556QNR5_9BACT|nr:4-hydroxy-tetrahydrodipicolinate reductase [Rariglobus hedericola]TSJ78267.1 4-hydroxy-tetrahydrodipicolinate reductase [Rariglobus hedericola]
MSLRIALIGARGRMGQAITAAAKEAGATVVAALDQGDDLAAGISQADAVIDFSFHAATANVISLCAQHNKALVIGTTGHSADEKKHLLVEAAKIPCVWSGNYSVGVNLLFALTRRASAVLGSDYDAEVIEMHHRFKKDAPSGTAARLLEIILDERKLTADALRHGREGITGERTSTEVGIHALRGGDVVGDHTVMFAALGERIELTHKASDRGIFARGAIRAAQWVVGRPAGVYDMQDVLGLK